MGHSRRFWYVRSMSGQPAGNMGKHSAETKSQNPIRFSPYLYRARDLIERFFKKLKQCRACRDPIREAGGQRSGFIKLASIRIWLRSNESAP
jgi:transposase